MSEEDKESFKEIDLNKSFNKFSSSIKKKSDFIKSPKLRKDIINNFDLGYKSLKESLNNLVTNFNSIPAKTIQLKNVLKKDRLSK